ncbi:MULTISPECIES: helix-turn-helix domain-containing protein [unclassified Pseudoalteromonas]|uniref:helix-turn-helix domain-containing protein n=1 Tax=unclassified Pseudoalteromonas TaxID=194690 RepID=UPI0018CFCA70|nr:MULTISPECIES: helix-turn-helix domain-containing protein [unclassified Pseudoalteromonas]MBH0029622.1 helix-turn-helix domain-containing protein [Pseudoalteromonas sp. SWYJZ98]MDC9566561.1 helix-turn-helix domain-containing protein [Pseudoalteromonas sp. GAB2316C]MDC9570828.1 helix-turn-helix domain-containing protein [Pseudoalteromonas sp. GABNB9D]MDC9574854.1 helix-turn-helix domain-containing protein [Pseudoalteromonas sp. GABNS16A]MDC9579319.1 helix-turn-helix domain-containing protein |tara:strand:- start:3064 stop:3321 length:258 start_codon:yes stop_codon:yes gene_type:complete
MSSRANIGKQISTSRKALGYTQQKISEIAGINKTTISEVENGRFTGSFDIFERLLDAVDLQFEVTSKQHSLPDWDTIEDIFSEDD